MKMLKDIINEFQMVIKGNTLDALIPPVLFLILINQVTLLTTLIVSGAMSGIILLRRMVQKDQIGYAALGIVGVAFTTVLTYISNNAANFFLADIVGTAFFILITIISLLLKRPIASYLSHITRGWELAWFQRQDIRPAYMEVSIFWLFFLMVRLMIEITLYVGGSVNELALANVLLGFPITIIVLTLSYVYGIWRLKTLGGPGIDEFIEGKEPPFKGQTKGF